MQSNEYISRGISYRVYNKIITLFDDYIMYNSYLHTYVNNITYINMVIELCHCMP